MSQVVAEDLMLIRPADVGEMPNGLSHNSFCEVDDVRGGGQVRGGDVVGHVSKLPVGPAAVHLQRGSSA
jgi:hypothetical protein